MFVWKLSHFIRSIEDRIPDLGRALAKIRSALGTGKEREVVARIFARLPHLSIDYGLMERVREFLVVRAAFDWNDVGNWQTIEVLRKPDGFGNVSLGKPVALDSWGNIVRVDKRLVALVGVRNLIVVDTKDALLVCRKERAQDVKALVDQLRRRKLLRYL